jgi:hypothetical protein
VPERSCPRTVYPTARLCFVAYRAQGEEKMIKNWFVFSAGLLYFAAAVKEAAEGRWLLAVAFGCWATANVAVAML